MVPAEAEVSTVETHLVYRQINRLIHKLKKLLRSRIQVIQAISSFPHSDKCLLLFPIVIYLALDFLAALHFPAHYMGIIYF